VSAREILLDILTGLKRGANAPRRTSLVGRAIRWWYANQIPLRGCNIIIDTSPPSVLTDMTVADIFFGMYEGDELRFVKTHLPRERDVVELGASVGAVSSLIAKVLNPASRLICVEANDALIPEAARNVKRNAPSANVQFLHGAIDYSINGKTTQLQLGESQRSRVGTEGPTITVPRLTLSSILADNTINDYTLVCDIEGAEESLLQSDAEAFRRCRTVIIELHPIDTTGLDRYIQKFSRLGFELQARSGRFHRGAVCVFGPATCEG
jgi:FkbM family methyltransferase